MKAMTLRLAELRLQPDGSIRGVINAHVTLVIRPHARRTRRADPDYVAFLEQTEHEPSSEAHE